MRQDQFDKLQIIQEALMDEALKEADPTHWHGQGLLPNEMTRDTRGDRYWCKKNAVATLALVQRIHSLSDSIRRASQAGATGAEGAVTDPANELDDEVAAAEKEAKAHLKRIHDGAGRDDFMKKAVSGR